MVLPFVTSISRDVFDTVPPMLKELAYGIGCTTWEVVRNIVIPYTRVGVIGGVMLGLGRALGETMAVTFVIGNAHKINRVAACAGNDDLREHRQRVHRGGRRPLHLVADRARPDPVHDHLRRPRDRPVHADAPRTSRRGDSAMSSSVYPARRRRNAMWMGLSVAAAVFGLTWLFLILAVLFWKGFAGLSLAVFTQDDAAARQRRRPLECDRRQPDHDGHRRRRRHAARHAGGHLPGRIRPLFEARRWSSASSTTSCSAPRRS